MWHITNSFSFISDKEASFIQFGVRLSLQLLHFHYVMVNSCERYVSCNGLMLARVLGEGGQNDD